MKYIFFDSSAIDELINGRHYQSAEFKEGKELLSFIRGNLPALPVGATVAAVKTEEGGFVISPTEKTNDYLVFDFEEAGAMLELDDIGLLLAIQKTLRFCKKLWAGFSPSKHERIIANNKAVVFPYPIGFQTSLRVSIDRNPDEKRRTKRETGQAYLVYKFGASEGNGPNDTPRFTNFRKANEAKQGAYLAAKNYISGLQATSRPTNPCSLAVTELSEGQRSDLQENGLANWRRWLTTSQLRFVESSLTSPHRIEGPAGTGKTLSLVLKALHVLERENGAGQPHRSLFVTHSQATKQTIENLLAINGGESYLSNDLEMLTPTQSITITTLHELCAKLLRREISDTELVDRDAYESKLTQKLYAIEAVERAMVREFNSHKIFLSDSFKTFLETTDRWAIAEMLQHEISVQIKGRAEQDITKYQKLPALKFGLPTANEGDRAFVFVMYDEYQKELVTAAQFDTDDVVLSAMSQLGTPIWRRRRSREGFDSIFIDETHLFNLNELSIFHKMTRSETTQPIAYSVDRSQALGDRGWTNEAFEDVFDPAKNAESPESTKVKSIFRCSPEIIDLAFSVTSSGATLFTNFHNPLTSAVSAFSAEEERKCEKPQYIYYASDESMYSSAFVRAESMAKEMGCFKADIAIIAFGEDTFSNMQALASSQKKPIEIIKSRGDTEAVNRAKQSGRFVLSAPEFVGGLEFSGVILVGVDIGRVPPTSSGAGESQAFLNYAAHQRLYVAITRARYRVEVLGTRARGISEALSSAQSADLLSVIENPN